MKVPYTVIVGEKEETDNTVSIRIFKTKEQDTLSLEKFVEQVSKEYNERK
jgi:threonyl-tRNA synthetase